MAHQVAHHFEQISQRLLFIDEYGRRNVTRAHQFGAVVGEVEVVGGDVRGVAVHEAARVMSEAGPDEVLVSETTRALASASGLTFEDRGVHMLKGIGDVRLYAAYAPESS